MNEKMIKSVVNRFLALIVLIVLSPIRIFSWREILRKTKEDELPQLINILKGTLSAIGSRQRTLVL